MDLSKANTDIIYLLIRYCTYTCPYYILALVCSNWFIRSQAIFLEVLSSNTRCNKLGLTHYFMIDDDFKPEIIYDRLTSDLGWGIFTLSPNNYYITDDLISEKQIILKLPNKIRAAYSAKIDGRTLVLRLNEIESNTINCDMILMIVSSLNPHRLLRECDRTIIIHEKWQYVKQITTYDWGDGIEW